jgi:capsular polysaccharide biosynthesis protein
MELSKKNLQAEDQIDIVALLAKVWSQKKLIFRSVCVFGIIGVVVALSTPNQYTASSMFTPSSGGESSGSGGLKGLASLAGINIGSMSEGSKEISPMLYGKIVEGATFKKELLDAPLKNIAGVQTLKAYFNQKESSSSFMSELPSKVIGLFKSEAAAATFESVNGIESVSEDEHAYFIAIDEILTLSINDKGGFIEMIAQSENPQVAAQVAKNGEVLLQQQIIAIKTKSSLELLEYLEEQYADKKVLLNEAQDRLSRFKDRNLNIATNRFSNNQTRLESELQTATAVFKNVVTQLEQVKFQVTKDTPVFSILKPVVFPSEKSAPKRSLIVVVWLFLGVVTSIGYVLAKEPVTSIVQKIVNKED